MFVCFVLKTVKKEDIVTNILWHEQNRYGYNSKSNISRGFQNRIPDQKWQGASDFGKLKVEEDTVSSLRPNYGARNHQPSGSTAGSWRRGGYGSSGSRRESNTNLDQLNSRAGQGGSSFWKSRCDESDDWRSDKQSRDASGSSWHKNSAERSAQTQRRDESFRSNMSNSRWR